MRHYKFDHVEQFVFKMPNCDFNLLRGDWINNWVNDLYIDPEAWVPVEEKKICVVVGKIESWYDDYKNHIYHWIIIQDGCLFMAPYFNHFSLSERDRKHIL